MRARSLIAIAALAAWVAAGAGCTAAMPPDDDPEHLRIHWRKDFATARAEAERLRKPILLVTAAGDLTGFC